MALTAFTCAGTGCESHILPMRPVERVETWAPDEPVAAGDTTQPATQPGTASVAAATAPATGPANTHLVVKVVDPNQTARFIYRASYDNIWQQAITVLNKSGFALDRQDYRLGVLSTQPLPGAQFIEFWKPQQVNFTDAMENTINNQRRTVRLTISKVPGKADFYEIGMQVLVERRSNPTEVIGGPLFVEGSGFGRNAITLQSDYAQPRGAAAVWVPIGHDPDLERKLIDALFQRI